MKISKKSMSYRLHKWLDSVLQISHNSPNLFENIDNVFSYYFSIGIKIIRLMLISMFLFAVAIFGFLIVLISFVFMNVLLLGFGFGYMKLLEDWRELSTTKLVQIKRFSGKFTFYWIVTLTPILWCLVKMKPTGFWRFLQTPLHLSLLELSGIVVASSLIAILFYKFDIEEFYYWSTWKIDEIYKNIKLSLKNKFPKIEIVDLDEENKT